MPLKILLAIHSAHDYDYSSLTYTDWFTRTKQDRLSGIRDSWLKDVIASGVDYKIVFGRPPNGVGRTPLPDELFLDCPDNYYNLPLKTKATIRYALENNYDYLLKVDDDTYVDWDAMLTSGFEAADYTGGINLDCRYCPGNAYWLSQRAMELLDKQLWNDPRAWAEDLWVGMTLYSQGIKCKYDERYYVEYGDIESRNPCVNLSTLHNPQQYVTLHSMSPDMMRSYYDGIRTTSI